MTSQSYNGYFIIICFLLGVMIYGLKTTTTTLHIIIVSNILAEFQLYDLFIIVHVCQQTRKISKDFLFVNHLQFDYKPLVLTIS